MSQKSTHSLIASIFFLSLFVAASCGSALAETRQQLTGHVPEILTRLKSSGRLPSDTKLNLAIGLPLRNQESLSNLLQVLYDPGSPQYRHYLTPEQFTEQFGPTVEDYEAVVNFARANGFAVTATHADRMLLEVTAAAADVERAFQVNMRLYSHPTERRSFFATDTEPSVPENLRIADIGGLNNFGSPHPKSVRRKSSGAYAKNTSMEGSGPNGNLIGSDYRAAYIPGVTLTGTGQTVGVVEFDGFYANDINFYESFANLTNPPPLKTVLLSGFNGAAGDGNGEVALDIEMVMSMAPGLSEIVSFETSTNTSANVILSAMAASNTISQFACSWDFIQKAFAPRTTMDNYFVKFGAQGQSFFDASGDQGAYVGAIPEPDDDPNITIVGGTTLFTSGPGGSWQGEVTWNAPDFFESSGGGISTTYPIPSWQAGVKTNGNGASTTHRNTPDVSIVADNVFIVADDGQSETSGGTSVSAQIWGALAALINQQALASGNGTIGFINPAIYKLYKSASYPAIFDDITIGSNTNGDTGFFANADYDLCTGLGAPTGGSLIIALAAPDAFLITPGRGVVANGPSGGPFTIASENFVLSNTGTNSLNWSLGGAPAWLDVSSTGGTITPGGTPQTVTVNLNSMANSMTTGVYVATLAFSNLTSGLAQYRQFTLQIGQNLIHDGSFETGDLAYWTTAGLDIFYYEFVDSDFTGYTGYSPFSGDFFVALGSSNELVSLSETFSTVPGQAYLISYWLENPSGATPNQFIVNWNTANSTNTLYNQSNLGSSSWENSQFFALATSNTTTLQFLSENDLDYFALDDVSVAPVPVPTIQGIQEQGQTVNITWGAISGLIYQVQYSTNLEQGTWTSLGPPITANGDSVSTTEVIGPADEAFYRIMLMLSL